ncbi:alpha/beta hydrolase [Flindersiella endophytica]
MAGQRAAGVGLGDAGLAAQSGQDGVVDPVEDSYPAIWCSDWLWNVSGLAELQAYRTKLAQTVAPHTKLSPFWSDITSCLNWSGPFRNPQHRLAINGTPPILVSTARYDVATPYAWNLAAAQQIPNSVLLTYDGAGHSTFRNSPNCARGYIERYLIRLTLPPTGTHCPAEYPTQPSAATTTQPDTAALARRAHTR